MRAFDQAGNVRDRGAAISVELHHTDDRMQRREWIWRDFRLRRGKFSKQSRFSGVRITNQSGVGNGAQFEQEIALLALFAFGVLARRAVTRTLEMHVAFAARAALAQNEFLVRLHQIGDRLRVVLRLIRGINNRADRDLDDFSRRGTTVHFLSLPVTAVFRLDDRLVKKRRQIIGMWIRFAE